MVYFHYHDSKYNSRVLSRKFAFCRMHGSFQSNVSRVFGFNFPEKLMLGMKINTYVYRIFTYGFNSY